MNLYLCGYRATGKTTVGKLLADSLNWKWVDSDHLIEKQASQSIAKIFSDQGEEGFRDLESAAVLDIARQEHLVVSLGGGAVLREQNQAAIRGSGKVVWLSADVQTIARRLAADSATVDQRPSLTDQNVVDEVQAVLTARLPIYKAVADLEIETDDIDPERIATRIVSWLGEQ